VQDVFAAGDCAAAFDRRFGKHRLNQHWEAATRAGAIVGENMAGGERAMTELVGFQSQVDPRVGGSTIYSWGEPRLVNQRFMRGVGSNVAEIGMDMQGRCAQVTLMGLAEERDVLRGLVESRAQIDGIVERLKSGSL